jgi:dolichol kinase
MNPGLFIEFRRKAIHLFALIIPAGLYAFPTRFAVVLLLCVTCAAVAVELLRFGIPAVQRLFMRYFSSFLREHESRTFTGSTSLLISASLCALFLVETDGPWRFSPHAKNALFYAFSFLILGDALAAIFGKRFGRRKIMGQKTYIGTLACFLTGMAVYGATRPFMAGDMPWTAAVAGATLTAFLEVLPVRIDDNLLVPPPVCFLMVMIQKYGGIS